ncbi:MAG: nucleotidyl transferase AbiEii/AbiGii toxin family protein [Saprospiraceae bacterium]|nr:nucleotidyl transferase AbiEii/AbiGii toxin family protein [Saprospiraceae bacterium]
MKSLMSKTYLEQFTLVGGTALALQIGHRKSIDLDLFSVTDIDTDLLLENLQKDYRMIPKIQTKGSLISDIEDIKVDFIRFKYSFAEPVRVIDGIRLLSIADIAPMKIDAIAGRGSKKDFYDLYYLLEQYSLQEILDLYSQKYQHSTLFHVIKSLAWFEDAEPQALPGVLDKKVTWEKVKKRIVQAVSKL